MSAKPTVFISYSRADKAWKDRLVRHLHVLSAHGLLDVWEDSRITTGSRWRREIEQAIGHASVAILLISADFLSSKFVLNTEVPQLLERRKTDGVSVVPILIAECDWQGVDWLAAMQFHADARPMLGCSEHEIEASFARVARDVRRIFNERPFVPPRVSTPPSAEDDKIYNAPTIAQEPKPSVPSPTSPDEERETRNFLLIFFGFFAVLMFMFFLFMLIFFFMARQ